MTTNAEGKSLDQHFQALQAWLAERGLVITMVVQMPMGEFVSPMNWVPRELMCGYVVQHKPGSETGQP